MLIESSSIPKYRDLSQPGDDVLVVVPQRLYAVFDGATDTTGVRVNGQSAGRFAASQAALAMVGYVTGPQRGWWSARQLLVGINQSIRDGLAQAGVPGLRAGTTVALVEEQGDSLRFLIVGDSAIRLNGQELFRLTKDIDTIYTAGRIPLFKCLQARGLTGDALEQAARQFVVKGLAQPGQTLLTPEDVDHIITSAQKACAALLQPDAIDQVAPALQAGIAGGQYGYCNRMGHSLGYAVLNGGQTQGPDMMCFVRPKSQVHSIELFTDGYPVCPTGTRVKDWEEAFFRVEAEDFSKTGAYAGVKGSSSQFFSDDRTVLSLQC